MSPERRDEARARMHDWADKGAVQRAHAATPDLKERAAACSSPGDRVKYEQLRKLTAPGEDGDPLLGLGAAAHITKPDFLPVGENTAQQARLASDQSVLHRSQGPEWHPKDDELPVSPERREEALEAMATWAHKGAEARVGSLREDMEAQAKLCTAPDSRHHYGQLRKLVAPPAREGGEPEPLLPLPQNQSCEKADFLPVAAATVGRAVRQRDAEVTPASPERAFRPPRHEAVSPARHEDALATMHLWHEKGAEKMAEKVKQHFAPSCGGLTGVEHRVQYDQLRKLTRPGEDAEPLLGLGPHPRSETKPFVAVGQATLATVYKAADGEVLQARPGEPGRAVSQERHDEAERELQSWSAKGAATQAKKAREELAARFPAEALLAPEGREAHHLLRKLVVPTTHDDEVPAPMFTLPPHPLQAKDQFRAAVSAEVLEKQHRAADKQLMTEPKAVPGKKVPASRHDEAVGSMHEWSRKGAVKVGKETKKQVSDRVEGTGQVGYAQLRKLTDPADEEGGAMIPGLQPHPLKDKKEFTARINPEDLRKEEMAARSSMRNAALSQKPKISRARHDAAVASCLTQHQKGTGKLNKVTKEYLLNREREAVEAGRPHLYSQSRAAKYTVMRKLVRGADGDEVAEPLLGLGPPDAQAKKAQAFDARVGPVTLRKGYASADHALRPERAAKITTLDELDRIATEPKAKPSSKRIDDEAYARLGKRTAAFQSACESRPGAPRPAAAPPQPPPTPPQPPSPAPTNLKSYLVDAFPSLLETYDSDEG